MGIRKAIKMGRLRTNQLQLPMEDITLVQVIATAIIFDIFRNVGGRLPRRAWRAERITLK